MEPFKINIEIALSKGTLDGLATLITTLGASLIASAQPSVCEDFLNTLGKAEQERKTDAPAAAPAQAEQAVEMEDMPEEICDPAPEKPARSVEVRELFDAVKRAQTERKVTPAAIRKLYSDLSEKWGVEFTSTRDCPEQCRADLLDAINNLGQ